MVTVASQAAEQGYTGLLYLGNKIFMVIGCSVALLSDDFIIGQWIVGTRWLLTFG